MTEQCSPETANTPFDDPDFVMSEEVQTEYERGVADGKRRMQSLCDEAVRRSLADELEIEALKARIEDLKGRSAGPAQSPLMEATQAQHVGLPKGEPAKFVRNGKLETCQCRDCRDLAQSPSPEAMGRAYYLARYENEGAKWEANDHKMLWIRMAQRYHEILASPVTSTPPASSLYSYPNDEYDSAIAEVSALRATVSLMRGMLANAQSSMDEEIYLGLQEAKMLIGAKNDTFNEAVKASNKNKAWHILDRILSSVTSTRAIPEQALREAADSAASAAAKVLDDARVDPEAKRRPMGPLVSSTHQNGLEDNGESQ